MLPPPFLILPAPHFSAEIFGKTLGKIPASPKKIGKIDDFSPKITKHFFETFFRDSAWCIFYFDHALSIAHSLATQKRPQPLCGMVFGHTVMPKLYFLPIFLGFSPNFPEPFQEFSAHDLRRFDENGSPGIENTQELLLTPSGCDFRVRNVELA